MMISSIGVSSGEPRVTAYIGAMLHEMNKFGFDPSLQHHFMDEMKQLTSPYPIVDGRNSAISGAANVGNDDIGAALQRATQNSGPQNAR